MLTNRGTPDRPELRTARLPDIKRKLALRNAVSNDIALNPVHWCSQIEGFNPLQKRESPLRSAICTEIRDAMSPWASMFLLPSCSWHSESQSR